MSHTPNMPESAGTFATPVEAPEINCWRCKEPEVTEQVWDSSCGGWTDYKYTCHHCGYVWWVDGIDS